MAEERDANFDRILKDIDETIGTGKMDKNQATEWLSDLIEELESRREAIEADQERTPED